MTVTDQDEWLRPGAVHDEVTLAVDDAAARLVLRARLLVTPAQRRAHLNVDLGGVRARHDAEEAGPPPSNWDRMRIGGVEWRMVEPLRRWDLSAEDVDAGLRVYLGFSGSGPCVLRPDGYEQPGTVSGQVQLAEVRATLTDSAALRTHTWAE